MGMVFPSIAVSQQIVDLSTGKILNGTNAPVYSIDPKWTVDLPGGGMSFLPVRCGTGVDYQGGASLACPTGRWLSPYLDINGVMQQAPLVFGPYTYSMTFYSDSCPIISDTLFLDCYGAYNVVNTISINGNTYLISTSSSMQNTVIPLSPTDIISSGLNTINITVVSGTRLSGWVLEGHLKIEYASGCPLPIEYAEPLSIKTIYGRNTLHWTTSHESNLKWFVVERSESPNDGFCALESLDAKGNSDSQTTYIFNDNSFSQTINYYRLRLVDQNGGTSFSKVVMADNQSPIPLIEIWPNPINEVLYYKIEKDSQVQMNFYDMAGAWVVNYSLTPSFGVVGGAINLKGLNLGNYLLIITDSRGNLLKKQFLQRE